MILLAEPYVALGWPVWYYNRWLPESCFYYIMVINEHWLTEERASNTQTELHCKYGTCGGYEAYGSGIPGYGKKAKQDIKQCYSNSGPWPVPGRGDLATRLWIDARNIHFVSYIPHNTWMEYIQLLHKL